jgi:hypothetical protein
VARTPPQEDDQLSRLGSELRDGSWAKNARQRARRRRSPWNLLLLAFGLTLWLAIGALLGWGAEMLHGTFHPATGPLFSNAPLRLNTALVLFPCVFASICPAMLLTNFLVYRIPPARLAMELEDRGYSGVDYSSSQRALLRLGIWICLVCLPLVLVGVSIA